MLSYLLAVLILLCLASSPAALAQAQVLGAGTPQPPSPPRTLAGVVVNSVTGRPIARALVQAGQHAMLTDGEGRFEFQDVTEIYYPTATKPGYFPGEFGGNIFGASASQAGPVEIRLVPEAILSGLVTDAHGAPIEGVTVLLRTLAVSNGLKHWEQRTSTRTNAEGEFRIAELQAGEYALQTALKLDGPPEGQAVAGFAPAEYPVLGANGSGALHLRAGDHLEANIGTRLEKLYPVSGVIAGFPVNAGWNFTARTATGLEMSPESRHDAQTGAFRTLLPSGTFELRVQVYLPPAMDAAGRQMPGDPGQQLIGRRQVTVAQAPVSGVSLTLEPMAALPVEVTQEGAAELPAGEPPNPSQWNLVIVPAEAEGSGMLYSAQRAAGHGAPGRNDQADGPLVIPNVPPGQYFLEAQPPPPWYVASAFCGGTDLTRERLAITGSAAGCTLRVVLRDNTASINVSVPDTKERQPVYVYAIPLSNLSRDVQVFTTGMDGTAKLDSMPPGQYLLLASRHAAQLAFRDADSLQRYAAESRRVDLTPGANAEVHLDVMAGEP